MENCPCKGCTARFIGCHASCEKYADYRKRLDTERADRIEKYSVYREQEAYRHDFLRNLNKHERKNRS